LKYSYTSNQRLVQHEDTTATHLTHADIDYVWRRTFRAVYDMATPVVVSQPRPQRTHVVTLSPQIPL